MRINNAIRSLKAKIRAGVANNSMTALQQTAVFRTTVGQTESTGGQQGQIKVVTV